MRKTEDLGNPSRVPSSMERVIRVGLFGVMGLFRPLISLATLTLLLVCVVLLLFSLTFPPGTHFPSLLVGGMALGCAAVNYGYGAVMNLVDPTR